jgi:hypothetical protein
MKLALLVVSAGLASGCSLAYVPIAEQMLSNGHQTSLGHRFAATLQPSRDVGFYGGVERDVLWTLGEAPFYSPDQFRDRLVFGYASLPLPHRSSRVGLEGGLQLGVGKLPDGAETVPTTFAGARLAVPVRFTPHREFWELENKLALTPLIVPSVGLNLHLPLPLDDGDDRLRSELEFGLGLRLHFWSALLP